MMNPYSKDLSPAPAPAEEKGSHLVDWHSSSSSSSSSFLKPLPPSRSTTIMELGLDCGDVHDDDDVVKLKVAQLYNKRCGVFVDRDELPSCSLRHLQKQSEKDSSGHPSNHIRLLHLLLACLQQQQSDNHVHLPSSMETEDDTDSNTHDPKYTHFLSHFKRHGKSYAAEFKEQNGLLKSIEYEREDNSDSEHDVDFKTKIQIDVKKENTENQGHLTGLPCGYKTKTPTLLVTPPPKEKRRPKISKNAKNSSPGSASLEKNDFPSQNLKCNMERGIVKEQKTNSQRSSRNPVKSEQASELHEKDPYLDDIETETDFMFAHCKVENSGCISSGEHDTRVEEEEEEDSCQFLGSPMQGIDSSFRQKVMSLLRKPYDHEEYKKLWRDVKIRKKLSRHRDLRNGRERPYSASEVGKSYLDHYKDLKKKIRAVKDDQCKKLNILRGFFFWLQNLAQEGVFRPWQDAACLAVIPGSCETFFNP